MLNVDIARYVALHRSLGRNFAEQERLLRKFGNYATSLGDSHTRIDRIYDWCRSTSSQNTARAAFTYLRNFSLFVHAEDPIHEVPPAGVFGRGKRPRPTPHIIEAEQIAAIMTAALGLPPKGKISPYTVE